MGDNRWKKYMNMNGKKVKCFIGTMVLSSTNLNRVSHPSDVHLNNSQFVKVRDSSFTVTINKTEVGIDI